METDGNNSENPYGFNLEGADDQPPYDDAEPLVIDVEFLYPDMDAPVADDAPPAYDGEPPAYDEVSPAGAYSEPYRIEVADSDAVDELPDSGIVPDQEIPDSGEVLEGVIHEGPIMVEDGVFGSNVGEEPAHVEAMRDMLRELYERGGDVTDIIMIGGMATIFGAMERDAETLDVDDEPLSNPKEDPSVVDLTSEEFTVNSEKPLHRRRDFWRR